MIPDCCRRVECQPGARVNEFLNNGMAGEPPASESTPQRPNPGIRGGPLPQVRKGRPAADQGESIMEKAEIQKDSGDPKRLSWVECEPLPLRQLREGRGVAPSRGDVIEAEIADVNGRAAGKVMLEALEVKPAQEAGIFARVACTGIVDPELGDYAVQIRGTEKDREEFVFHLCAPQQPGRCGETGAALHCEKWKAFQVKQVEDSIRNQRRRAGEPAEVKGQRLPRLGRPFSEQRAAKGWLWRANWAWIPPVRLIEPKNLKAPRSSQLESRNRQPRTGLLRRRVRRLFRPRTHQSRWYYKKLKEARARLGRKRRGRKWLLQVLAERVLESTAETLVTADLARRRRKCNKGTPQDTRKRNQGE